MLIVNEWCIGVVWNDLESHNVVEDSYPLLHIKAQNKTRS